MLGNRQIVVVMQLMRWDDGRLVCRAPKSHESHPTPITAINQKYYQLQIHPSTSPRSFTNPARLHNNELTNKQIGKWEDEMNGVTDSIQLPTGSRISGVLRRNGNGIQLRLLLGNFRRRGCCITAATWNECLHSTFLLAAAMMYFNLLFTFTGLLGSCSLFSGCSLIASSFGSVSCSSLNCSLADDRLGWLDSCRHCIQ